MGAVLAILAHPSVTKLASGLVGKLLNRKGKNGPVDPKVSAPAGLGAIITLVLTILAYVDPGLSEALASVGIEAVALNVAAAVAGVMTVVNVVIGYYQPRLEDGAV